MAKLKNERFTVGNTAGDKLEFQSDVTIDGSGIFSFTIPSSILEQDPDFIEIARDMSSKVEWRAKKIAITQPRDNYRVSGPNMSDCRSFIEEVCKLLLTVETKEELVILYGIRADYCASVASDGKLFPNGYFVQAYSGIGSDYGRHVGNLHANNQENQFSVGVGAKVLKKVISVRGSSSKVRWKLPDYANFAKETWGEKLNTIIGINIYENQRGGFKEIPYTEEAAKFFFDSIMGLAEMGHRLTAFFDDEHAVQKAISNKSALLELKGIKS